MGRAWPCLLALALCLAGPSLWAQPLGSQQRAVDEAEAIFQRAVTVQERGLRKQAERLFLDAEHKFRVLLRLSPRNAHVLGRLSAILHRQRRFADARDLLLPAMKEGVKDTELRWQLALAEEGLGHHQEAVALAQTVAETRADATTFVFLARLHFRLGDLQRSAAAWDRYAEARTAKLACQGPDREISEMRAEIAFRLGQHRRAVPILMPCQAAHPGEARLLRNLASALVGSGEPRRAIATLGEIQGAEALSPRTLEAKAYALLADRQAAKALVLLGHLDPGSATPPQGDRRAWARRQVLTATAHTLLGASSDAHAAYARALAWDPDSIDALAGLGVLLAGQGRYPEALAPLTKALEKRPRNAEVCHYLGRTRLKLGRTDEGVGTYRACLALEPDSPDAKSRLATVLLRAYPGQPTTTDEALALCEEALAIQPASTAARLGALTARRLRARREFAAPHVGVMGLERAVLELEAARALDATDAGVLADLAVALLELGRATEAQALLAPALDRTPASPTLLALYVRAATLTGSAQAAADRVASILGGSRPDDRALALELGALYAQLGQVDMSADALASLSDKDPDLAAMEGKLHLAAVAQLFAQAPTPRALETAAKHAQRAGALLGPSRSDRLGFELAQALLSLKRAPHDGFATQVERLGASEDQLLRYLSHAGLSLLSALSAYLAGDFALATTTARKALATLPDASTGEAGELRSVLGLSYLARARSLASTANLDGADREAALAASYLPEGDPSLLSLKAALAQRRGQRGLARRLWRSLELREVPEALLGLSILAFDEGDLGAAVAYGERYVRLGGARADEMRAWLDAARPFVGKGGPLP